MNRCANLDEVRTNIDALDRRIVDLLVERSGYVSQAASFKPNVEAVVVPERIEAIITKVRAQATALGAEADLLEGIYRPLIDAYIAFERRTWNQIHEQS